MYITFVTLIRFIYNSELEVFTYLVYKCKLQL